MGLSLLGPNAGAWVHVCGCSLHNTSPIAVVAWVYSAVLPNAMVSASLVAMNYETQHVFTCILLPNAAAGPNAAAACP